MREIGFAEKLTTVLKLSDDGYILLDEFGAISDANDQAGRMFGISSEMLIGKKVADIPFEGTACRLLDEALTSGIRQDLHLTLAGGRHIFASLRRKSHSKAIELIKLCDLDGFDYRRQLAQGGVASGAAGLMGSNRTRPDFEAQRTLSPDLHRALSRGERALQQGARILITGESGVGKSEIARFLHSGVSRASDPFISINCAVTTAGDLASVLFGDGAEKEGALQQAAGGTLFLDEVGELPLGLQARLVGYLEDNFSAAGSQFGSISMAPRLITATNRDLQELVRSGRFRADLYYRIAVVSLGIPPLRQMPQLIPYLTDRFLLTRNRRRKTPIVLPDRFRNVLDDYSFPGNIRELLNIVQRASIFIEDALDMEELMADLIISGQILPESEGLPEPLTLDLKTEVRRFERALIDKAIRVHGSKRQAAKALGVDIGTVSRKTTD